VNQATKETTAFMRRMLSRSLVVLGGAVTITAAAWAISSASAAADPSFDFPQFPSEGIESVALPSEIPVVTELTAAIGRIIGEPDPRFGENTKEAFDEFGRQITEHFDIKPALPVNQIGAVPVVEIPVLTQPGADLIGNVDGPAADAPVVDVDQSIATATTLVGVRPGAIDQKPVVGAPKPTHDGSIDRRGSPETSSNEAPALPGGSSPLAPLSIPAPVGTGHTGASTVDAPSFGLLSSVPSGTDMDTAEALRSADIHVPVTVGAQPGVTPD
jgi:hypothetical protein